VTAASVGVSASWLALREPADAAARSSDLVERIGRNLPARRQLVIHDLGCGTGSMGRWLAPQLAGAQHWIMHDRDADLLARAEAAAPHQSADGLAVTVETRQRDITRLDPSDLAGAGLITASALLDMFSADELDRFAAVCVSAACPVLVTISVIGEVELSPAEPLDGVVAGAFNAHQRRMVDGRRLLGPDASAAVVAAFTRRDADVVVRHSPWRLGADQAVLAAEWFNGWVGAACEQQPELSAELATYAQRRMAVAAAGRLRVTVHHHDLLVWPR
jgi:SAM-dependent methyltransferase